MNAYLAQESIADRHRRGLFGELSLKEAVGRFKKAVDKGLLKTMSKMGISVISSYRGGYNFEAIGLSRALVGEFFPGMQSRISGVGLSGIARRLLTVHKAAWNAEFVTLPVGGLYKLRKTRRDARVRRRADPYAAVGSGQRQLSALPALRRCGAAPAAGGVARLAGLPP